MAEHRPIYYCRRASGPPVINGRPDSSFWAPADLIGSEFHPIGREGDPSPYFLEVRALWDQQALYVSFISDPSPVEVTKRMRDLDLFNECAVEVFLGAGDGYYEIEVNPLGAVLDLYFPDASILDWQAYASFDVRGMRWAVGKTGEFGRWCAQLAIPWSGVPEVTRGTHSGEPCLFVNFARSQRLSDGNYDLTTWSTARRRFCELEEMGCLVLTSK